MKQGWEIKKLGEVCEIVGGSTPKTNEPSYWDGEHYWVTPAELDGAKYISSTSRTITDEGVKSAHLQLLPSGTVLLSSRAPIGKVAITTAPMYCNQGFKNLVCFTKLHNEFAYWFLYHRTEYLNSLGTGATFKEISKRVVEQIPIPIPSLAEQRRIVEILDREFGRIDALKANAEQNLQHAKDLFQAALKQELQPKEGWETKTLKQIGNTQTGTTPKTANKDYYGSYIPFIKPADVNIDGLGGLNYANEGLSKLGASAGRVFDANSILMVCIGATIGKVGYADRQVSSNQQINVLTPHNSFNSKYLYYYMTSSGFQHMVIREGESAKATLPIINKSKWGNLSISYPCKDTQDEIVSHLDELNKHCKALEENYRKAITLCDDMKQALLRKAFNGKL